MQVPARRGGAYLLVSREEHVMSRDKGSGASKKLSWLLRHGAGETGIDMDAAGWVAITDVLRTLHMGRAALEDAVVGLEPMVDRAARQAASLRAMLGCPTGVEVGA